MLLDKNVPCDPITSAVNKIWKKIISLLDLQMMKTTEIQNSNKRKHFKVFLFFP